MVALLKSPYRPDSASSRQACVAWDRGHSSIDTLRLYRDQPQSDYDRPLRIARPTKLDRRIFPHAIPGRVRWGRRLDHTIDARQFPRLNLELRDVSVGGIICPEAPARSAAASIYRSPSIQTMAAATGMRLRPRGPLRTQQPGLPHRRAIRSPAGSLTRFRVGNMSILWDQFVFLVNLSISRDGKRTD